MPNRLQWRRRALAGVVASTVAVGAASLVAGVPASADPGADPGTSKDVTAETLGAHDLDLLAEARAKGDATVVLIVATDRNRSRDVAAELEKLGGRVANRVDEIGYVRATVPTGHVLRAAKIPGVTAIDLNESIPLPDPEPATAGRGGGGHATVAPPGATTPADNPYLPTGEIGAVSFKKAHHEWDGRGVTIGIMDSGVDLDNPALQTTSTGERKIVDWFTATDPLLDSDATWRAMLTTVTGPTFSYANQTWTAPAGTFRMNRFNEAITAGGDPGGDVNRDGDTSDLFGILYDPASHDIWVDVDQDNDFTDDGGPMRPYAERHQVGHFGTDDPATEVRDQMPFVVEYREDVDLSPAGVDGVADFVNIGIVESAHGSHVAGITAGNDMFGNRDFDGVAPGAKLVSARACSWGGGCTAAALTDGMVELVTRRHVDVVNMSIGGLPALNDGNNARARLYDRLIEEYGVQLVISAGNSGPGINTIGDPSLATNVLSVAAGVSRQTWLADYGSVTRTPYQLFNFSSRGPREDGGLKPDITAPGAAISTVPMWMPGAPVAEAGYPLPAGYEMMNGTSMAAPEATGGAALLLSAARARGRGITPAALRAAVGTSARWIHGEPAAGQGNGLMSVPGAWDLLKGRLVEPRSYTSSAPVCTPISDMLAAPGSGTGIYNRCAAGSGGLRPGQTRVYQVKLTRTSGPGRTVAHRLEWLGNDGTFSSARRVDLPLNRTVSVDVQVRGGAGLHSAILRVDDPGTAIVDFSVLNTVLISTDAVAPGYAVSGRGAVERNDTRSILVTVPEGAAALQVDLSGLATGSQTRFIAVNPWGVPVEPTSSLVCYTNFSDPETCKPQERSYEDPMPGVWEIEVESRRTSPVLVNPYELTARVQGVTVQPGTVTLPDVAAGEPTPVSWTVTNAFGPVTVTGNGGPLGSSASARRSIGDGEDVITTVDVPEGATRLDVAIGNPADLGADLDLYVVFNGVLVGQSADGDSEESVSIVNPAPGTYQVEIYGYAVPGGTTEYDYRDVFYSPALGSVSVPGAPVTLPNGGSATMAGSVTVEATPAEGRQLFGELRVVTDEGAVVGRGNVLIGQVTNG